MVTLIVITMHVLCWVWRIGWMLSRLDWWMKMVMRCSAVRILEKLLET